MLNKTLPVQVCCLVFLLVACAGTDTIRDDLNPPSAQRQGELTRLFDQLSSEDARVGERAATEAAQLEERDLHFMGSLWGTRGKPPDGARRLGAALSDEGRHQDAFDWFERAFMELDRNDERLPYLRYEMAFEYVQLGRNAEAVDLLANRLSTLPLPEDLEPKYEALIEQASRG